MCRERAKSSHRPLSVHLHSLTLSAVSPSFIWLRPTLSCPTCPSILPHLFGSRKGRRCEILLLDDNDSGAAFYMDASSCLHCILFSDLHAPACTHKHVQVKAHTPPPPDPSSSKLALNLTNGVGRNADGCPVEQNRDFLVTLFYLKKILNTASVGSVFIIIPFVIIVSRSRKEKADDNVFCSSLCLCLYLLLPKYLMSHCTHFNETFSERSCTS